MAGKRVSCGRVGSRVLFPFGKSKSSGTWQAPTSQSQVGVRKGEGRKMESEAEEGRCSLLQALLFSQKTPKASTEFLKTPVRELQKF
jgi:hypothetical protein